MAAKNPAFAAGPSSARQKEKDVSQRPFYVLPLGNSHSYCGVEALFLPYYRWLDYRLACRPQPLSLFVFFASAIIRPAECLNPQLLRALDHLKFDF